MTSPSNTPPFSKFYESDVQQNDVVSLFSIPYNHVFFLGIPFPCLPSFQDSTPLSPKKTLSILLWLEHAQSSNELEVFVEGDVLLGPPPQKNIFCTSINLGVSPNILFRTDFDYNSGQRPS